MAPPPPTHLSLARGVQPPLYQDAVARRALRPPLFRSVSVPAEPPPRPPPAMDVTYAVVNKARRGGGAGGRDHAPSARDHAPSARDHAPSARDHPSPRQDHAPSWRDHASSGSDHAPSGSSSLPASPRRRPSPSPAASPPPGDDAYEVVTPQGDPSPLGFNFRIPKPKGPRDPPAEWSRV